MVEQTEHRRRECRFLWLLFLGRLGFLNRLLFLYDCIVLFRFLWITFLFNDFRILNGYALIQRILEVLADVCHYYLFHVRSDAVHSALMDILHCRLAVWIGVTFGRGVDDMVTMPHEIGICPDTVHVLHVDKKTVRFRQFLLGCILL